jgi:hypothetical protein
MAIRTFDCGPVQVSVLEMQHYPRKTFSYILEVYGVDAALSLYNQWSATVPRVGAQFLPLWDARDFMRAELEKAGRPTVSPSGLS